VSEYYKYVRDCLEGARNQRFCAGAEGGAAEIKRLRNQIIEADGRITKMRRERDHYKGALEQAEKHVESLQNRWASRNLRIEQLEAALEAARNICT